MNTKHTPGPWKAQGNEIHAHGGIVAEINTIEERGIADARLISAAPELLAALELIELLQETALGIAAESQRVARDAIAKATGEPHVPQT